MRWPSSVCIAVLIVSCARVMASPGSTSAHCMQNTTWMNNALGQIPCLVVGKLIADPSCLNAARDISPLTGAGRFYPNLGAPGDACMCSEPLYSLFAACALCQRSDAGFEKWGDWTKNCTHVYSTYQGNIPNDTQIPNWAQLDVEAKGTFDLAAASSAAAAASSTSSSSMATTSTSTSSSPTSSSTSSIPSNPTTAAPFSVISSSPASTSSTAAVSGSSHNAGAIAGGVVGGLAFFALLLGVGFWVYRRRSRLSSTTSGDSRTVASSNPSKAYQRSAAPLRYYDPSDPSTYPDAVTRRPEDVRVGNPGVPMSVQYGAGSNAR